MRFHRSISFILFGMILLQSILVESEGTSCKSNRFIDYNQMVETHCLIETCILHLRCNDTRNDVCPCKRAFVVRYNVTTEHEDDEDDEHEDEDEDEEGVTMHLAVINQQPEDDELIYVSCKTDVGRKIRFSRRSANLIRVFTTNGTWRRCFGNDPIERNISFYCRWV